MTHFIRYFIFIASFFISITGYAVDHIICNLTNSGIPAQAQANQPYANTYTCINTYPASFPAIQLAGVSVGNAAGTSVGGSCAIQPLASGGSCQFILNANFTQPGTFKFYLSVSVGSLYFLDLPLVTTTIGSRTTAVITWPGFNSGFAQADSTENGFGSYIADAKDSSGHKVTYTFAILEGPGTITPSQTGSFSLTGVNGSTVIQITATADDAAPVVGNRITVHVSDVPLKVIAFFNNSNETIYPVIEAPVSGVTPPVLALRDPWLQAQFAVSNANISTLTFQATKLHRIYVNGVNGIPPMQTAVVSVPFYSYLVPNPSNGNIADEYVDWWKSMRVFIYDVQSNLIQTQSQPGVTPVTLYPPAPVPTCVSGCSQLSIFNANTGMPTGDPQQLTEYTFAAVVTDTPPYPINNTIVNYNYSAVDQVYLPIAMEPYGSSLIGYTGTVENLTDFRNGLASFQAALPNWPIYPGLPYPRIPGAYNVVVNFPLSPQNAAFSAYWASCSMGDPDCALVFTLFDNNYFACSGNTTHLSGPAALPMSNLYGYVSFCSIPLPSTGDPGFQAYLRLQYNYQNIANYAQAFNPYTALIHQILKMNVYAFSVDDLDSFIRAVGNGLVITVGGPNGLSNTAQYNRSLLTTISPGALPGGPEPYFTHYGVCSHSASSGQLGRGESFTIQLPSSSYPCEITLQDNHTPNRLFHFILKAPAPLTTTAADIGCTPGDSWCTSVVVTSSTGVSTARPLP